MKATTHAPTDSAEAPKGTPRPVWLWKRFLDWLRDSLFVLPVALIIFFAGLAGLSLYVDSRAPASVTENPFILAATVSGGRAILTTVAGATITVAAIVFSITALSTQMAATQYSPRAVGGFFEDIVQQALIGLVVGTFTFSLVLLAGLNDVLDQSEEATPTLSVTLAIVFGVLSAISIVGYIYHSLRRMQIDSVVRRIAAGALEAVRREQNDRPRTVANNTGPPEGKAGKVKARAGGWIVGIDSERLLESLPPHSTARVDVRVGEPISVGDVIATVWTNSDTGEVPDSSERGVRRSIETDSERSLESDPTFGIRQLSDIALRALSPALNDPTTAVDVIQHLKVPLREILGSDAPLRVLEGSDERRVFFARTPSRSDYVHAAFAEIRLAASQQPTVLRALLDVLQELKDDLEGEDVEGRLAAVSEEFRLTMETVRKSDLPAEDIKRILRDHREDDFEDE